MATATSHHDMKIVDADFYDTDDRDLVFVTLEDGSERKFLDVPKGRVYLERRQPHRPVLRHGIPPRHVLA